MYVSKYYISYTAFVVATHDDLTSEQRPTICVYWDLPEPI